jgi:hypothetical protein
VIRCPLDPGWVKVMIRIRIRDDQPKSWFRDLEINFLGLNIKFFDADPGPGSATLIFMIYECKDGELVGIVG